MFEHDQSHEEASFAPLCKLQKELILDFLQTDSDSSALCLQCSDLLKNMTLFPYCERDTVSP